ncbi:hypothetical protein AAC387_Pa11g1314 [Persea americana]
MERPHVVCVPFPAQGHITPMFELAKLLHSNGFYVTFVNTHFNHNRLFRSSGLQSLKLMEDFQFEAIPDGLPEPDRDATQDIPALCKSTSENCLTPFRDLLRKLNTSTSIPRISCIVSDGTMSFTLDAAEELGIPQALFWTWSACGHLGYLHYQQLVERGLVPFKDESFFTNGSLDAPIDWIPGMNSIRLKDLPSFIRTTDPDDIMINFIIREIKRSTRAKAIILNTFDDLEHEALQAMKSISPQLYTIGPLSVLSNQVPHTPLKTLGASLWKEDSKCVDWLDTKGPRSVVFVNFGSIAVMTEKQLEEMAWGLANSNHPFLWVIRPDLVGGESAIAMLYSKFVIATEDRGLLVSWCPQKRVLAHPSIGVFLTHCGWNSMLESICGGVPVICWPFFAEQQTNCRYACKEWGIGMEIDNDVKRDEVEGTIREMMEGAEKGKEMSKKAVEWKERVEIATKQGGSSYENLNSFVKQMLWPN